MSFVIKAMASDEPVSRGHLIRMAIQFVATGAAGYFLYKYIDKLLQIMDPTKLSKRALEKKARNLLKQLGRTDMEKLKLTEYELNIASQLIIPKDITVNWNDIGGLEDVVREIKETVILPFHHRKLFNQSKLFQPPKGILLYGPPGCGKTMIAKATAKEAGFAFLNIEIQQLTDKWYGESQKLAAAVFSLAYKLQPSIIFIDEIDVFLQMRSDRDHEVTAMMKSTFMSLWDGLVTNKQSQIMVMGATNRPQTIDQAILRRMPIRLHVPMPTAEQRTNILEIILSEEDADPQLDLKEISENLNGFSGSDLREMCRHASVARVKQHLSSKSESDEDFNKLRALTKEDLMRAAEVMQRSKTTEFPFMFNNKSS